MSISTFVGIQTSLRGLLAQQRALDVTSHNIANASTVGYTRQEVNLAATQPLNVNAGGMANGGMLGTGVDVQSYRRVRDQFLDLQYRGQNMQLGDQTARSDALQNVELSFAEPGDSGIQNALDEFFGSWSDLSNSASSGAAKQAVIDKSRTLAQQINDLQGNLASARQAAADEYTQTAGAGGQINQMANDLSTTLNAIRSAEMTGAQPNDLYDRRDLLLDQLSTMGQVSMTPSAGGSFDVSLGGVTIVDADDTTGMASVPAGAFPLTLHDVARRQARRAARPAVLDRPDRLLPDRPRVGRPVPRLVGQQRLQRRHRHGLLHVRHGRQRPAADQPQRARGERHDARGRHRRPRRQLGRPRRLPPAGRRRRRALQAARDADGQRGLARAARQEANAQVLTDNVKDRRDSVSGVSLDEEMTNIIRFQRAYQASARAMSTTDEMLDTLINRAGRVGL